MRVSYAKDLFSKKSLSEEFYYICRAAGCYDEISDTAVTLAEIDLGMCLETKRADILGRKSQELAHLPYGIKSAIACFKYRAYAGALFNGIFLNTEVQFNRANIKQMERRIKYLLGYFAKWYSLRDVRKENDDSAISKM